MGTCYRSGYDLCCVQASVSHGHITFVCFPVSMALLHIKDCLLPSWWISFNYLFVGGIFLFSLVLSLLLGLLADILHISRYGVGSNIGMRLRMAFWLFYVALLFAVFV